MLRQLRSPPFAPEIERQFQASYYSRVQPTVRLVSGVLAVTLTLYLLMGWNRFAAFMGAFSTPYLAFCWLLFGLTYVEWFGRIWQSATVALAWLGAAATLIWLGVNLAQPAPLSADAFTFGIITHLSFMVQTCVLMVTMAAQLRPALMLQSAVGVAALLVSIFLLPLDT